MSEQSEALIALTADIVAAHVSNNSVAVGDVSTLIANVHGALNALGTPPAEAAPSSREPAVSVRSSVKPDAIACLVCGTRHKTLKRHLQTAHGLTPAEYRSEFGLKNDYPMTAPNYSEQRATLARNIGLGSKGGRGGRKAAPKGKGKAKPAAPAEANA